MGTLVYGVGVNDADYRVEIREATVDKYPNGRSKRKIMWSCPFYKKWGSMLMRCYSEKYHKRFPAYKNCTVCEEWLIFSNFRKWMASQDWGGKHLDKDLLVEGNKVYSPETCVFISKRVNTFLQDRLQNENTLIGCWENKDKGVFIAECNNPFKSDGDIRPKYLGSYFSEMEAHLVWKNMKHIYACELSESKYVDDSAVADALRKRYVDYTKTNSELANQLKLAREALMKKLEEVL